MEVLQGLLLFTEELACGEGFVIDTPNILASKLALDHMILFSSQFQIICQAVIIVPVARDHHVIGLHERARSHAITPLIHQQPQHKLSGCNLQRIQPLIADHMMPFEGKEIAKASQVTPIPHQAHMMTMFCPSGVQVDVTGPACTCTT